MKELEALIEERARKGGLNSLTLIASSTGPAGKPSSSIFKAHCRTPEGVLSTGDDVDPVKALILALRGGNAGVNRTKRREDEMDFG